MTEPTVKCEICGEKCTGETTLTHMNKTGHNSWELILPLKNEVETDIEL